MTAQHKTHRAATSSPLFGAYLAAVDDSVKSNWNAFFEEESEELDLLYSLLSSSPMLETRLRSLEWGILMSGNWSPAKRHQHLSLVNDWINYCRFRGETDLCMRMATASLTRPKNPASPEKTAVALRLYNSLRNTLYEPVTSDISFSPQAQVGRAVLSGILFGGLLSERAIWALLRVIHEKPINLNGLPAYSLSISHNGLPEAETRLWVPDALTGALIGNLHQNQIDLKTIVSEKRQSGFIMTLIQTWIGESSDLKLLNIINDVNSPGRNSLEGAERGSRKRVTLNYLLELIRTIYGLSIPAALIDYFSGQFPSHSLPLSRLLDTPNSVEDTAGKPDAGHEDDRESEVTSVLDLAAASLSPDTGVPAHSIQVAESPSHTILPTAKFLGYDHWTRERFYSLIKSQFASIKPGSPMARLLVEWSLETMKQSRDKTTHPELNRFRQSFNRCFSLLMATDTDIEVDSAEAAWFDGVYGELLDACPASQKRYDAGFLSRFHHYLVERHCAAQIQTAKTFQDKRRRPRVHADLITIDEFSAFKDRVLNQGSQVGNEAYLTLSNRHPDLPRVVALIAVLGYRCGLRRREALHLRLCDVHGPHKTCLLVRPHRLRRLKTHSSQRQIPCWALLEPDELDLLKRWTQHRLEETGMDLYQPLFSIPSLNPGTVSEDMVFPSIHRILRAITGRPEHRFHLLRHSCASLLLLKLMVGDSEPAQCWFARYPKTLKWLRDGLALRQALANTPDSTRKLLYSVSSLLGHSAPDISIEHYIHILDVIGATEIQAWREHPQSVLINASDLVPATARRALKDGWAAFVLRHWEKPTKTASSPLVWVPANQSNTTTADTLAERPSLAQVARAANVVMKTRNGGCVERLQRDTGWSEERCSGFYANTQCLFGLSQEPGSACPATTAPEVDYLRKTSPSAYRSSISWKEDDKSTIWLFQKLQALALSDSSAFDQVINTYARLSHKDYFHVILKGDQDIQFYQHLITTLKIPKSKITFAHLVGQRSTKRWINSGKQAWRNKLGLTKNTAIKRYNINNSLTVGEHGWIGVKIMENFCHGGLATSISPRASQMFPFVMNSMVLGKGVFW